MASTINASTSAGLVTTADTSGVLVLQSNGTTAQTISGTGTTMAGDATISGLTVGKGAGAVASNTVVGAGSLNGGSQTGTFNTVIGYQAATANTTGNSFVAIGPSAFAANTTGSDGVAIGSGALAANTTGSTNHAVGRVALLSNTTGSYNSAFGGGALQSNTTASNNTAVGYQAGNGATTGGGNTFLGISAGSNIITGQNGLFVGNTAQASSTSVNNELVIGSGATFTGKGASTGFITPNGGGVYQGNNSSTWSVTSDQRLKKNIVDNTVGLDAITSIRVRNFEYRTEDEVTELSKHCVILKEGVQLGVIAQELQAVLPDCVKTESTGVMSVNSDNLTWYMINAIKELKAEIETLKGTK